MYARNSSQSSSAAHAYSISHAAAHDSANSVPASSWHSQISPQTSAGVGNREHSVTAVAQNASHVGRGTKSPPAQSCPSAPPRPPAPSFPPAPFAAGSFEQPAPSRAIEPTMKSRYVLMPTCAVDPILIMRAPSVAPRCQKSKTGLGEPRAIRWARPGSAPRLAARPRRATQ